MKTNFLTAAIAVLGLTLMTAPAAHAGAFIITDLYNTGVDNAGVALGDNVTDSHYALISQPGGGSFIAETVLDDNFPIPPWFANNAGSRWIGPDSDADANGPAGFYTYRTSFTLPGNVDLGSVTISGVWGSDDLGPDILINGFATGNPTTSQFFSPTGFSIASNFVVGANTLDFLIQNGGGPTGVRVDQIMGMYDVISEPGTLALLGLGLIGLGVARRRKAA